MLGKYVRVRVTSPMYSYNRRFGYENKLNYGIIESGARLGSGVQGAYIMGVNHPVRTFDGRVIAVIRRHAGRGIVWVVAPKSTRYIINDIKEAVDFAEKRCGYDIECLYERSCGSIVISEKGGDRNVLLIKNKRSSHWGFPKGHVEYGETDEQTAIRETKEETGIDISLIRGFRSVSEYTVQGRVEKAVVIFVARALNTVVKVQTEEIDDYIWTDLRSALEMLKFDNDKSILKKAISFLEEGNAWAEGTI